MRTKKIQQPEMKKFFTACAVFLVFMIFSISYFFYCVQVNVVDAAENTIVEHVKRQGYHFREVLNNRYEYLEGIAEYMSGSGELLSEENLELMRALCEKNSFERMAIVDRDGNSTYEDEAKSNVAERKYFREAIAGERSLSDPIASKVDGERRVIMAVPIIREGQTEGVLAGSYDVGTLSHLLFEDIYGGTGYTLITTSQGSIVSYDGNESVTDISSGDDFLDYYGEMDFLGGSSIEEIKDDFASQKASYVRLKSGEDVYYLVYEPVMLGGWMLVYVVPLAKVQEDYGFIGYYELILSIVLLSGLAVLLMYIWNIDNIERKKLMRYAQTDALTGAVNKDSTEKKINQWLESAGQGVQAFFMLDVDNFKSVNDVYGHAAGDEALRQIGKVLAQEFRGDDIIGRIGGDEFVVMMKDIIEEETVVVRVETLCRRIREITIKGVKGNPLSCSVGICYSPEHGSTYQELYLCADKALYHTKENGRDGYTIYKKEQQA